DGRRLLVGSHAFGVGPGRAYVYRREGEGAASVWVKEAVIPPDVPGVTSFGQGAVLSAEPGTGKPLALVTHSYASGRGWTLFRREPGGGGGAVWEKVVAFRDTLRGDSASLDGASAAAGNFHDDTRGERAGKAMAFDLR